MNILSDFHRDIPRVLTISEIEEIIQKFVNAIVRAQKAGFDGVDINAASSHLLHNFLSPFWNRRSDIYGGTTENRARFLTSIIKEAKKRTGQDFPIVVLMNGIELGRAIGIDDSKCITLEESRKIAQLVEASGADAIQIRNHWLGYHAGGFMPDYLFYPEPPIPLKSFPKEYYWKHKGTAANKYLTEAMKQTVSIPVIIVGKLTPEIGERLLRDGKADFIGMTRSLQADPEMPNKLIGNRIEDIAPCTACATCLDQSISMARRCRINAAMGTTNYSVVRAPKPKKVIIIGGGPAGMEAARVCALRGHNVTLYEKNKKLGGLMLLAALIKGLELEDLTKIILYFKTQLKKLGVKVILGKYINAEEILKNNPDTVIIATGGTLTVPKIDGIKNRSVLSSYALHQKVKPFLNLFGPRFLGWLTKLWLPIGKRVTIIGGELHGFEIAEFLLKRGRQITIVDKAEVLGKGMLDLRLAMVLGWFDKKGVKLIPGVKSLSIESNGVKIITKDNKEETISSDSIIVTAPLEPDNHIYDKLNGKIGELYKIGDCSEPRMIVDAIADAWRTANKI